MLELARILGEYQENVVIVGGWVPELLVPEQGHVGSTDVDLALDHEALSDPGYTTILEHLEAHGYEQSGEQPFIFEREVDVEGEAISVQVDLMSGEYGGTGQSHRTQEVQDVRARKARGCDLAFQFNEEVELEDELPDGGIDQAAVRVASLPAFFVMKAMALEGRVKEKDAWDLWFCLRHYPGAPESIAKMIGAHAEHGLVQEALSHLDDKFASPDHVGPIHVADFDRIDDDEARERRKRDAYERVQFVLGDVRRGK